MTEDSSKSAPANAAENPEKNRPFKTVPVCHCDEQRDECDTCGNGYLTVTLKGMAPRFKKVYLKTRRIAVCKCGGHHQECSECGEGFLEMAQQGKVPHFKTVDEADPLYNAGQSPGLQLTYRILKCESLALVSNTISMSSLNSN